MNKRLSRKSLSVVLAFACIVVFVSHAASGAITNKDMVMECRRLIHAGEPAAVYLKQHSEQRLETWVREAEAGDAYAAYLASWCYFAALSTELDTERAIALMGQAAEKQLPDAEYQLGACYQLGGAIEKNAGKAFEWYLRAAMQGLAIAENDVGVLYANGDGAPKDQSKAVAWVRKSAEQGFYLAQHNLGRYYVNGEGVPADDAQAAAWFEKAAEQGFAIAQNDLATLYEQGRGVPKDIEKAQHWYEKAAAQGDATAQVNLGALHERAERYDKAFPLFKAAAEQDYPIGRMQYGRFLALGRGCTADVEAGVAQIELAAQAGLPEARELLAAHRAEIAQQNRRPRDVVGDMLGVEEYYPVGNHPEGSGPWWQDQIESNPYFRHLYGIPDEDF